MNMTSCGAAAAGKTVFEIYEEIEIGLLKELQKEPEKLKTILAGTNIEYRNCMLENDADEITFSKLKQEYQRFLKEYQSINGNQISTLFLGMGPSWNVDNAIPFDYFKINQEGNSSETNEDGRNVRKWLGVEGQAASSDIELNNPFWSLMQFIFDKPNDFYKRCVVRNYCPFAFGKDGKCKEQDGKWKKVDVSLAKLPTAAGNEIKQICRKALVNFIELLSEGRDQNNPLQIFILGDYDTQRIEEDVKTCRIVQHTVQILHPAVPGIPPAVWKMEATWQMLKRGAFISLFPGNSFTKFCKDYCLSIVDGVNSRKKRDRSIDEKFNEYYKDHYTAIFGTFVKAQREGQKDRSAAEEEEHISGIEVKQEKKDTSMGDQEQDELEDGINHLDINKDGEDDATK